MRVPLSSLAFLAALLPACGDGFGSNGFPDPSSPAEEDGRPMTPSQDPGIITQPSPPSGMGRARITTSRLLGIALLAMTSAHCCPRPLPSLPPRHVPTAPNECRRWDPDGSADEIRRLAIELRDELPDWTSTVDASVHLDYRGLKAAAIRMAGMPECVRRAVVREYPRHAKLPKLSGLFLLMRLLFVLPSDARTYSAAHSSWQLPVIEAFAKTKRFDYQWPVRVYPERGVIEVDRCQEHARNFYYHALLEYHRWTTNDRFPPRTPAEIEALEIREAP